MGRGLSEPIIDPVQSRELCFVLRRRGGFLVLGKKSLE